MSGPLLFNLFQEFLLTKTVTVPSASDGWYYVAIYVDDSRDLLGKT